MAATRHGERTFAAVHGRELANLDRVAGDLDAADLARCARVLAELTDRIRQIPDPDDRTRSPREPAAGPHRPDRARRPAGPRDFDLYLPDRGGRPPVVVLVHGLFPEPPPVSPRRTPFFRAYAAQLVQRGIAAVVLDHELTGGLRYPEAAATLDRTLSAVRADREVDGGSVAVWFFSGGGPLAYPVLAAGHGWLRCVALTYPLLPVEDIPGWPSLSDALDGLGSTPWC